MKKVGEGQESKQARKQTNEGEKKECIHKKRIQMRRRVLYLEPRIHFRLHDEDSVQKNYALTKYFLESSSHSYHRIQVQEFHLHDGHSVFESRAKRIREREKERKKEVTQTQRNTSMHSSSNDPHYPYETGINPTLRF